ncbi:MAG: hypothetical protein JNJ54_09860 [Myxococcaceae bacterium]|nr:hypothetical protein [Myxococcaceae bacterium]
MPLNDLFADPMYRVFATNIAVLLPTAVAWVVLTNLQKPVDLRIGLFASVAGACALIDVFLLWSHSGLGAAFFGLQGLVALGAGVPRLLRHLRTTDDVQH